MPTSELHFEGIPANQSDFRSDLRHVRVNSSAYAQRNYEQNVEPKVQVMSLLGYITAAETTLGITIQ